MYFGLLNELFRKKIKVMEYYAFIDMSSQQQKEREMVFFFFFFLLNAYSFLLLPFSVKGELQDRITQISYEYIQFYLNLRLPNTWSTFVCILKSWRNAADGGDAGSVLPFVLSFLSLRKYVTFLLFLFIFFFLSPVCSFFEFVRVFLITFLIIYWAFIQVTDHPRCLAYLCSGRGVSSVAGGVLV